MTSTRFETSTFANGAAFARHAPEECHYRDAVAAFAIEASPAAISNAIKAAHRRGFRLTEADAREAAVAGLRDRLLALPGYNETDVQWHAARRGRRERHLYA